MTGQSLNIKQEILNQLKQLIPNCFTEDKIDWEKLKVFLEDNIEFRNERYHLNWAGKTDAFRLLQAPTYKTLKPCREESVNFDETENLFIEGDNLEVLKTLQKSYFGKIKMIYIDPPYNTGNDFIYKDDYSETLAEYKQKVGDVDENGNATKAQLFKNTKENGQYHSNWLNMMYPRLFLARNLLRDDGVIFVSIDDNEVHNLRLMMDEIFGEENFVATYKWNKTSTPPSLSKKVRQKYEFVVCYEKYKNINSFFNGGLIDGGDMPLLNEGNNNGVLKFPRDVVNFKIEGEFDKGVYDRVELLDDIIVKNGKANIDFRLKGPFKWTQESLNEEIKNGTIFYIKSKKLAIRYERAGERIKIPSDVISKSECLVGTNEDGNKELFELLKKENIFSYPKPSSLVRYLCKFITSSSDLILDFFSGSGTTAHAVMELNKEDGGNRKFILVQLPEPTDPNSEAYKAGYKTIADIAKERIRRAAKKIQDELNEEKKKKGEKIQFEPQEEKKLDLGFKVFKLDESNFKQWRPFVPKNAEEIKQAVIEFTENVKPEATVENMLYELMLKNGKKLTDKVEKKNGYYVVNASELVLLLESIEKSVIDETLHLKPQKVIALDKLFNGNDQLKTNTVLQFSDLGIEFKSV